MKKFNYSLDVYAMHPKNGTAYIVWHERVIKLLKEKNIPLLLKETELHQCYHEDLSAWQVYYYVRSLSAETCMVRILWSDAYGREEVGFTNSEEIRDFLVKCDRLRQLLRTGK